jgi:KaiC/GvpD/RAD55 family RecA-like ATPase
MSTNVTPERGRAGTAPNRTKVQPIIKSVDATVTGLPSNLDAERFVLASVLLNEGRFSEIATLRPDDFSLERHGRIFACMHDLQALGEHIDRVTVTEELARRGELGADGVSYLVELTNDMPTIVHLDSYVRIVLNKSKLRRTIFMAQKVMNECLLQTAAANEILTSHAAGIQELNQRGVCTGQGIAGIPPIRDCGKDAIEYLHYPELPRGAVVALTGDSGSGKSTLASAWAGEVAAGTPVLVLDRENPIMVVAERLERLRITDGGLLRFWGGWLPEPAPQPNDPAVVEWVKTCDPRPLIVVDSMIAFHGGDENDAAETRAFMQQSRTLADLGATVLVLHHDGKAETAKEYRGSSDFKAAVDAAFHVSNFGADGRLDTLRLHCFKSRFGFFGDVVYHYADGRFIRDEDKNAAARTVTEQLTELLGSNPGISAVEFERLAGDRNLGRNRARTFLDGGIASGDIRCEKGPHNTRRHHLVEPSC